MLTAGHGARRSVASAAWVARAWRVHGVCMAFARHVRGMCMACVHGHACSHLERTVALAEVDVDSIDDVSELRDEGGRLEQQVPPVHGALERAERAAVPAHGVACAWRVHGVRTACPRRAHGNGVRMECAWRVRARCMAPAQNSLVVVRAIVGVGPLHVRDHSEGEERPLLRLRSGDRHPNARTVGEGGRAQHGRRTWRPHAHPAAPRRPPRRSSAAPRWGKMQGIVRPSRPLECLPSVTPRPIG